jgi:hypothetical protein
VALNDDTAVDGFTERDPAERSAFNRLFYRNRRPTWLGHWVSQCFCWWARVGLTPHAWVALHVRDRVSGRWRQDAVVLPSVAGEQYVVSMFGTISDWAKNVEAAQGDAAISHGGRQRVRLVPVPPEQRAPILSEYVRVASSGRKHFPLSVGAPLADFAAIASQYPVYRIERPAARSSHTPIVQNIAIPTATLVDGSETLNTILLASRMSQLRNRPVRRANRLRRLDSPCRLQLTPPAAAQRASVDESSPRSQSPFASTICGVGPFAS